MREPIRRAPPRNVPNDEPSGPVRGIYERLVRERSPAGMLTSLRSIERPERSRRLRQDIKSVIETMRDHIGAGRQHEARAAALAAMLADADYAIGRMRRDGALRASKYGYVGLTVAAVAKAGLDAGPWLEVRSERLNYLRSIVALTRLAPNAKALHEKVVKTLAAKENVALKTVLAILNTRFYHHNPSNHLLSSLKLDRYTIEDVSDAASLILDTYRQMFTIHDHCCNEIDVEGIAGARPVYERLLVAAIRLTKFKEAEVLVDGLPFQARWERGTVRVSSIDPNVEKSIRLGYVQGQNQVAIRTRDEGNRQQQLSVRDMIEKGFERGVFGSLLEIAERPVRRLRLFLPTAPQVFQIFRSDEVFRDEFENLMMIDVDAFGELDPEMPVTPEVTMMDLLKVQRYFNFISCLYQRKLETITDPADRAYLAFASTIPVIPRDQLYQQMELVLEDKAKASAVIELLSIDYDASHLDIQYTPLIDLGNYYVVAPHVLAVSNLVRNVTVSKKLRGFALEAGDPMVTAVIQALRNAGFLVQSEVEITVGGRKVELDLVAWRDGFLFLLECKNAYHPCSAHEMRNSFDHIRVARDQLDVRRALFSLPENQARLFGKLHWDVRPTSELYTGIVIANRIFHGAEFNGHPVRQAHELINVLQSGSIAGDAPLRFWKGDEFATQDLVTYLAGDSVATKQLEAMERYPVEIDMGGKMLMFESFALDPQRLIDIVIDSYGPPLPTDGRTDADPKVREEDAVPESAVPSLGRASAHPHPGPDHRNDTAAEQVQPLARRSACRNPLSHRKNSAAGDD